MNKVPLPPPNAEIFTTACDYCIVACGYKVYRWPVGSREGGPKAHQNALGIDFPANIMSGQWVSPNKHNIVMVNGKPHHILIMADADTEVVNVGGNHSIRGGTIAQKCYNPKTLTKDRLKYPMLRVNGSLRRISWEMAFDIMAEVSQHVIDKYGKEAWAMKMFSYQFWENTYALTKLALRSIRTAAFAVHDQPTGHGSDTPGLSDAGIDPFSAAYEDWKSADVLFISGTDPFESKTIIFTEWIMKGILNGMKVIFVVPRKTTGVAFGEKMGGLWLDIIPGTDTILQMALARYIIENGWEDSEFLSKYINNRTERDLEVFQANGFSDYKGWILSYKYAELEIASEITGLSVDKIKQAAEMIAKPKPDGSRKKTSFGIEKGNYWSNNYLNTASFASLGLICGAGNRPGQVISRFGGHQRGMMPGGKYPIEDAVEKFPGRKIKAIDLDRWVEAGKVRFAWVVGTTWLQAMAGSQGLRKSFEKMTRDNPYQITRLDKRHAIDMLKKRVDSQGMLVIHQDIYPVAPIGTEIADIVLPAAGWGEENFSRANGERRIRLYSKFNDAPGEAKPDWWIAAKFAQRMGFSGFDWKDSNEIFEEAAWFGKSRRTSYLPLVWYAKDQGKRGHDLLREYGTTGIQAPVRYEDGQLIGTTRLHDSTLKLGTSYNLTANNAKWLTEFKTKTGRANLLKTPWELFSDFYEFIKPKADELWVTSGRINEFWQSGFDDQQRRPYLKQRWPDNFLEIHPDDAKVRGIESGDMLLIESDEVPIQVGGFSHKDAAVRGVVDDTYSKEAETPDLIMQQSVTPQPDRGFDEMMSADVESDLLLDSLSTRRVERRESRDHFDFSDGLGEDSALGIPWSDIKAMTFTELKKNGYIKLTKGSFKAVAIVTDAIRPKVAFTYFLIPSSPANAVAPRVLDPVSQRYRYKLGKGRVRKIGESPYKKDLTQMSFKPRSII